MFQQSAIRTGVLARWFPEKGYGFIIPNLAGQDIFVHGMDIIGEIPIPSPVQYELALYNGKIKAIKVCTLNSLEGGSNESL